MTTWTERRLAMERGWVPELGLFLRRIRPVGPDPARATLVYVHGLGESGLTLEAMASDPQLADYDHVIPDLSGYGKSAWPDEALDLNDHARIVGRLIDVLDLRDVLVVGHSMGGIVGLYLCEDRTPMPRAFLNVEGNVTLDDCGFSNQAADVPLERWLDDGWQKFVDHIHDHACAAAFVDSPERAPVLRSYGASIHLADPRTLLQNARDLVEISTEDVVAERLARLDLPVLYLHGERGTGERSLGRLHDAGIETECVEDAGHWPFVDHPATTAGRLRAFVERVLST